MNGIPTDVVAALTGYVVGSVVTTVLICVQLGIYKWDRKRWKRKKETQP